MNMVLSCLIAPTPDGPWSYGIWNVDADPDDDWSDTVRVARLVAAQARPEGDLYIARPCLTLVGDLAAGGLSCVTGRPGVLLRHTHDDRGGWTVSLMDVPALPLAPPRPLTKAAFDPR